ncbi:hairy-related 1 [Hoplias malabaricus]|uniref:hairy-related 1 n=1 Tax=Hoplias malabaricus TaxID=27720 RepID=UPI0034634059
MGTPKMTNRRASKRVLKPVIEKKRRDRINQRLEELRTLLLDNTLDTRLQNPKVEKAEILELTVEYIKNKSNSGKEKQSDLTKDSSDTVAPDPASGKPRVPCISLHEPSTLQSNGPLYTAGFRECISRLAGFIECVEPPQRESFIQGLRQHLDSHSVCVPNQPWASGTPEHFTFASNHQLYPNSFVLHHPYPSPPYSLSPPPSPPFSTSPTYLSVPCHFPYPPSLSPLSSESSTWSSCSSSSFATSTPAVAMVTAPEARPPTPSRSSGTVPPRRTLFLNQQRNIWRPW